MSPQHNATAADSKPSINISVNLDMGSAGGDVSQSVTVGTGSSYSGGADVVGPPPWVQTADGPPLPEVVDNASAQPDADFVFVTSTCNGNHDWKSKSSSKQTYKECTRCKQRKAFSSKQADCLHRQWTKGGNDHGKWLLCRSCNMMKFYWPTCLGTPPKAWEDARDAML